MSLNILFLNHNVRGQGTFIRCLSFAKSLVARGHRLTILTSAPTYISSPQKLQLNGVHVICMPDIMPARYRNGGLGPVDTCLRCLYLLDRSFDIIENFDHRPAVLYPALVGHYIKKIPIVSEWTDLHGSGGSLDQRPNIIKTLIGPYENFTERQSKRLPSKLIVISQGLKNKAVELGISADRIVYIPGGADLHAIKLQSREAVRRKLDLPEDKKYLLYSAGTHYDIDLLIATVNKVHEKRPDTVLVTTGRKFDKKVWDKFNSKDKIIQLGFLEYEQYADALSCADLFVFPFRNSTLNTGRWPNKIGDYMAAGRPIVSNPTGDILPLFHRHHIGLLASEDADDFASKILRLIEDESLRLELGKNARQAAETEISWDQLTSRLEQCFLEVLGAAK